MSEFLKEKRLPKILKNHFYLKQKILVRVTGINKKENRVVLFKYDTFSKEAVEYDTAPYFLIPLFKIGEVAQMLNRSVETLRRYESLDLLDKAKKYRISEKSNQSIRLYTEQDIEKLAVFFANRRPVGRPSG